LYSGEWWPQTEEKKTMSEEAYDKANSSNDTDSDVTRQCIYTADFTV